MGWEATGSVRLCCSNYSTQWTYRFRAESPLRHLSSSCRDPLFPTCQVDRHPSLPYCTAVAYAYRAKVVVSLIRGWAISRDPVLGGPQEAGMGRIASCLKSISNWPKTGHCLSRPTCRQSILDDVVRLQLPTRHAEVASDALGLAVERTIEDDPSDGLGCT